MSKSNVEPIRPEAEPAAPRVDPETERIIRERLERDEPSEPWSVVRQRILERRPAP